jgi:hypothetical protein
MPDPSTVSVAEIAAYAAGGVILIGAFFAGVVSVIQAWRTMAGKVSAIEGHVNSEKTAAEGRENTLKAEKALLMEMLAERKQAAALLAQAASHAVAAGVPVAVEHGQTTLEQVERNTKDTATNTARTDAAISELKEV